MVSGHMFIVESLDCLRFFVKSLGCLRFFFAESLGWLRFFCRVSRVFCLVARRFGVLSYTLGVPRIPRLFSCFYCILRVFCVIVVSL